MSISIIIPSFIQLPHIPYSRFYVQGPNFCEICEFVQHNSDIQTQIMADFSRVRKNLDS